MSFYPGAVQSLLQDLPAGAAITPATLKKMVRIVRKYKSDAGTIEVARRITSRVPEKSTRGNIETLQSWVRDNIRYVMDPRGLEMVQTPPRTLELMSGDCDDKSVLLATLLETMGYATRFVAIATHGEAFCHVLPQVRLGARWTSVETIVPGAGIGWFPPDATAVFPMHV